MNSDNNPLLRRAEAAVAETERLRKVLEQSQTKVRIQTEKMARIGAELDPLLPHSPEEPGRLRAMMSQDWSEAGGN